MKNVATLINELYDIENYCHPIIAATDNPEDNIDRIIEHETESHQEDLKDIDEIIEFFNKRNENLDYENTYICERKELPKGTIYIGYRVAYRYDFFDYPEMYFRNVHKLNDKYYIVDTCCLPSFLLWGGVVSNATR